MKALVTVKIRHRTGEEKIVTYERIETAMELVNVLHVAGCSYDVSVIFDMPSVQLHATLDKDEDWVPY